MRPRWQVKRDPEEIAEMKALVAACTGKVTHCPPGVARGHETMLQDAAPGSNPHLDDAP